MISRSHTWRILSAVAFSLLFLGTSRGFAQQYPTLFLDVCPGSYYSCTQHHPNIPIGLGSITFTGGGHANGVQWQAVRPSGATIVSGTYASSPVYQQIGPGVLYRLRTNGSYYGFRHKGAWATTPVREYSNVASNNCCVEISPVMITTISQLYPPMNTYERGNRVFTSISGLTIPAKSAIYVKLPNGTGIQNLPVYIVDPDGYQVNTELRNTDSTGKVEYCIPARVDITDDAGISLWSSCDETWSNSLIGGKILVNYKGFYHSTTIPADVASGITRTITVPNDSTATIYRLGALKANQAVYVANANLTQLLSNASIATNTSGQAAFAIPNGTQFRFYVEDTDGTASYSDALTAPNNGTIRMVVQNMPTLTAPANNTAFSTSSAASFSWSSVTNAADYVWYIRPSTQSNYSGYSMTANGINAQFGVGTWYWVVCARDSAGNVIAQSQIRSFTVSAAGTQSLASPLNAPDNAGASVTITSPNVSAVNSQPAAFADTSELSEQIGELEYETLYGEYEELLNLYFGL